ncbi:MAG: ABC1 kinase family protein [Thermoanaerobaculia bacterium]
MDDPGVSLALGTSMQMSHVSRYRDLAILLARYGRRDFHLALDADEFMDAAAEGAAGTEPEVADRARAFVAALTEMGPTYVKFGQILSTRPDIVPQEYIDALESLQDDVQPFSYAEVETIVEAELGVRMSKAFESFEPVPIAAASLGQAHYAILRDGREVVVKVQRPGIREVIEKDLAVFEEIATVLEKYSDVGRKMNVLGSVHEARRTILAELDYVNEARNTELIRRNLAEFPEIHIPAVIADYSSDKVLTTELVRGTKVSKLSPLAMIEHDYAELAAVMTRAYLKQICVDGVWHSDPHPGNVFVRNDQLVLLDFGMTSRMSGEFQDDVIRLLVALTSNRGSEVAEICLRMGTAQPGFNRKKFVADISRLVTSHYDTDLRDANTGKLMMSVIGIANADEVQVPSELAMLAKTLLHLDSITRTLDPEFNPRDVIRDYSESLVTQKLRQKFHPRNFYSALLDTHQLAIDFPRRAREILDKTATGKLAFTMRLDQADDLLKGMHKIANRITVGLVIAAIIVGSSMLMDVPTRARLFGYPVLALVGYLTASAIGFYLIGSILMQDRNDRRKARSKLGE